MEDKRKAKIQKLEEEIQKTVEMQKAANEKFNEKIRDLRKKIATEKEEIERENSRVLLDLVKEVYGEINEVTIGDLKVQLMRRNVSTPATNGLSEDMKGEYE